MSDERKKVKSSRASQEFADDIARQLGFKPGEVLAVFDNVDGPYVLAKDGNRLLLGEAAAGGGVGSVAWYGDKAPNPGYPLVVPSVELDESDVDEDDDEVEDLEPPAPPAPKTPEGGPARLAVPPKHGAGSGKEPWAAYAAEHQIEVPDGTTREQIWHLLEQANIPTEQPA